MSSSGATIGFEMMWMSESNLHEPNLNRKELLRAEQWQHLSFNSCS
jgi:hypothetical protein